MSDPGSSKPHGYWSSHTEEERAGLNLWARERYVLLSRLVEDTELRILKYLMITNSGGAIAILSFLGASEHARQLLGPKFSLTLYVSGIIICGALAIYGAHHMSRLRRGFAGDLKRFYNDEIAWRQLRDSDEARSKYAWWALPLAYVAFGCFVLGSIIALDALFDT